LFFSQAGTPPTQRFVLQYKKQSYFLAPFRRLWGGAWFELGTAATSVWCRLVDLTHWATTSSLLLFQAIIGTRCK
jgi:hypothetical protein